MKIRKMRITVLLILALSLGCMTGCGTPSKVEEPSASHQVQAEEDKDIGEEKVIEIVLGHVKGASREDITDFEKEYEDGHYEYEVELECDGIEYEIEVDGCNGTIISVEMDD